MPNVYEPGKRPFHTIIPAFAIRGGAAARGEAAHGADAVDALLSFGVMGAAMQPQGHVQVLTNMVDFGMNPQAAGDAPRVRHEGSTEPTGGAVMRDGGIVYLEPGSRRTRSQACARAATRSPRKAAPPGLSAGIKRSCATSAGACTSAHRSRARTGTRRVIDGATPSAVGGTVKREYGWTSF